MALWQELYFLASLGVFGLIFGSFANVVIWRLPNGASLSSPPSSCPACGHPIRWYDNIPVVSWFVLRASCRDCGAPISRRYPLVEILSGVLWVSAGLTYGLSWRLPAGIALFYALMVLAFIDVDTGRLPNPLVGLLAAAGLLFASVSQFAGVVLAPLAPLPVSGPLASPLVFSLLGAVLGGGLPLAIAEAYRRVRGREGLGMGDVKLGAAMGLFLGPYVLLAHFTGSLPGSAYGLLFAHPSMTGAAAEGDGDDALDPDGPATVPEEEVSSLAATSLPFGPFLAIGGLLAALFGPSVMAWYVSLFM